MAERTSISSNDYNNPVIDDATVGFKADAKTLNQLSSSAEAAKKARGQKALAAFDNAMKEAKTEEVAKHDESGMSQRNEDNLEEGASDKLRTVQRVERSSNALRSLSS
jgi:hypothetical protein